MRMTTDEIEDYARQHNMTFENLIDMVVDNIGIMNDQEVTRLAKELGIDHKRIANIIENALQKYRTQH
jgi:hypothetical protein